MQPLKAHVHNGRLVLDEPTDLLKATSSSCSRRTCQQTWIVGDDEDDFDNDERRALHEALDEGIAAARAGDHVDAQNFVNELLARS